ARYQLTAQDEAGALASYRRGTALEDPQQKPVTRELADLLFNRQHHEQAEALYRALHEAAPTDQQVALRLTETLLRLGRHAEAEAVLEPFEAAPEATLLRVMLAEAAGEGEQALRLVEEAISKQGKTPAL